MRDHAKIVVARRVDERHFEVEDLVHGLAD